MDDPDSNARWWTRACIVIFVFNLVWFAYDHGEPLLTKMIVRVRTPSTQSTIRRELQYQELEWNAGNLDGFMSVYWQSDDLTFFSGGTVTKGWQATLDRYRKRYQEEGKEMGQLEFNDLQITALTVDHAIARGHWKVVTSKESFEGLFTLVLKRIDGKWKIVHDHTSAADPPKPPVQPVLPAKNDDGRPVTGVPPTP
jgi:beta-aspartyl-peptidase (threonine type)